MPYYKSRLFKEQLIFIINDAKDKILFVDLDFEELIIEITHNISTVKKIVFFAQKKNYHLTIKLSKKSLLTKT